MRLFTAINFNSATKSKLIMLRDDLKNNSSRGNFTAPENMHLTLVFIGECDARQTAAVRAAVDIINFFPFELTIDRVGRFARGGGDIWWAGISFCGALSTLHADLLKNLMRAGFKPDARKYEPHVTLGREVAANYEPKKIEPFGETVARIDLMKSERVNGRLVYTEIYGKSAAVS